MRLRLRAGPLVAAAFVAALLPAPAYAARRVTIRSHTGRTALILDPGHPIRRLVPRSVIVRPAPRAVVIGGPLTFLPLVAPGGPSTPMPARQNLVWDGAERILNAEDWVDMRFAVDVRGTGLLLEIQGRTQVSFAEVVFAGGQVRVVDFRDRVYDPGTYSLLHYRDGRSVKIVRLIVRSQSPAAVVRVLVRK